MLWRVFILMLVAAGAFGETKEAVSRTVALWDKTGLDCARRHEIAQAEVAKTLAPILDSIEGAVAAPVNALGMGYGVLAAQALGVGRALLTGVGAHLELTDAHCTPSKGRPSLSSGRFAADAASWLVRAREWVRNAAAESTQDRGGPESARVLEGVTQERSASLAF